MMFTRSQFLSCSGFLGFLKVIKGDWQEMLPDTWSVLIDGSGSVVLAQAEGQMIAQGSSLALGCWPCRDLLLPGAVSWAEAEGEGAVQPPLLLSPRPGSPILEPCFQMGRVMVWGRSAQQRLRAAVILAGCTTGMFPCSSPLQNTPLCPSPCWICVPRSGSAVVV